MTVATIANADPTRIGPRGFVPPHGAAAETRPRLSHLDPKPLWLEPVEAESPWRSPTFWIAYALVMPVVGVARLARRAI